MASVLTQLFLKFLKNRQPAQISHKFFDDFDYNHVKTCNQSEDAAYYPADYSAQTYKIYSEAYQHSRQQKQPQRTLGKRHAQGIIDRPEQRAEQKILRSHRSRMVPYADSQRPKNIVYRTKQRARSE